MDHDEPPEGEVCKGCGRVHTADELEQIRIAKLAQNFVHTMIVPSVDGFEQRIGANAVVTKDVPTGAVMVGIPARPTMVEGGAAKPRFVPYGTPCSELFDPATQKVELLRCELEAMRRRLDLLLEEGERERRA